MGFHLSGHRLDIDRAIAIDSDRVIVRDSDR